MTANKPFPDNIFYAMLDSGALIPGSDHQTFGINFAIVASQFPSYLVYTVKLTLSEFEEQMYLEGYMTFTVLPDGMLEWKPTGKQFSD